jgi:hypothetical protein
MENRPQRSRCACSWLIGPLVGLGLALVALLAPASASA